MDLGWLWSCSWFNAECHPGWVAVWCFCSWRLCLWVVVCHPVGSSGSCFVYHVASWSLCCCSCVFSVVSDSSHLLYGVYVSFYCPVWLPVCVYCCVPCFSAWCCSCLLSVAVCSCLLSVHVFVGYVVNVARGFFLLACLQCIHFLLFLYRFSSFSANHQLAPCWVLPGVVCGVLMCVWTSVLVLCFLVRCVGILAPGLSSCPRYLLLVCILPLLGGSFVLWSLSWSWSLPACSCSSPFVLLALCMRTVRSVGFWLPPAVSRSLL